MSTEPERFLTISEAAELANYPESVIQGWLTAGLPYITPTGGVKRCKREHIRIRRSALLKFISDLEVVRRPTPPAPEPAKAWPTPRTERPRLSAWRDGLKTR